MALSKMVMNRVEACAIIAVADKREKIEQIAASMEGDIMGAARRYILGILKAGIRRGAYRTYSDALEALEREQMGDRQMNVTKGAPDSVAATVARINAVNALPSTEWEHRMVGEKKLEVKRSHSRNMGKVYGALYVQWIEEEEKNTVEYAYMRHEYDDAVLDIELHIKAYITEYIGKLSPTSQKAISEIVASRGMVDESIRLKAYRLYKAFPAQDAISASEFVTLIQKYAA